MFAVFPDTWQSYVATVCTKTSLKNVIKEKHHSKKDVQSLTMEFYQVPEKSYLQHRSQSFLI